jgi:predicted RNA binding protein YcfA (HicA-like mRNA interferase family)
LKLPRDVSGIELASLLRRFGYQIARQTGSHMRLRSTFIGHEHVVTVPVHDPLKTGTLNGILLDVAGYLGLAKSDLVAKLFG